MMKLQCTVVGALWLLASFKSSAQVFASPLPPPGVKNPGIGYPIHQDYVKYVDKPSYSYEYGVIDDYTGDVKSVYETRDGDYVNGGYKVLQPDGILRVVTYKSDPIHGFQSKVRMLNGAALHPIPPEAASHYYQPITAGSNLPIYFEQKKSVSSNAGLYGAAVTPPFVYAPHSLPSSSPNPTLKAKNKKYKGIRRVTTSRPQYYKTKGQYYQGQVQYYQGQPHYNQGQLQYYQGQPQYSQGRLQYNQGQPQYYQGQPQYHQGQPQYYQAKPQFPLHANY